MSNQSSRNYVVVFRAPAAVRFEEDSTLQVKSLRTPTGSVTVTFRTRYDDSGLDAKIPRELWIDARGTADGLNDAINQFGMAASQLVPIFAVSENAAVLELQTHLAFENTSGSTEREFFQSFLPDERGLPRMSIRAKPRVAVAVIECLFKIVHRDRILRACAQYHQALMYWAPGQELLALAHLYMGVEAITHTVLKQECVKRGLDESALAAAFVVDRKGLDAKIRSDVIFAGDRDCYQEAKRASDGFEHGFLAFDDLQKLATKRRNQTAKYLRDAIFSVLAPPNAILEELQKRETPVGAWRIVRNFRGRLLGKGDELAAPDQEYPLLRWHSSIKSATKAVTGEISFTPDEKLTAQIADGISFKPDSYEVYGPETGTKREPVKQTVVPNVIPRPKSDHKREAVHAFLSSLNRDVLAYGGNEPIATNLAGAISLSIFAECRSQFQAIVVLLKQRLPNESLHIAQSLVRNRERLQLLATAENRLQILFGWVQEFYESQKCLDVPSRIAGFDWQLSASPEETIAALENLKLKAAAEGIVPANFPVAPDFHTSSPLFTGGSAISKLVIGGFGALMGYSKPNTEGVPGFTNECEDTEQIAFVAAYCSETILLACEAVGQIFSWGEFSDLDRRLDTVRTGRFERDDNARV